MLYKMLIISAIGLFWRSHCRFARREQSVFEIALAGVVLHHPRSAELAETSSSLSCRTPTSSSWVNSVERWFGELTQKAVRRGTFASVPDLVQTIEESLRERRIGARPRTL